MADMCHVGQSFGRGPKAAGPSLHPATPTPAPSADLVPALTGDV